jgi:phosphatidylinositol alpha-1,6-mannosyltransferase
VSRFTASHLPVFAVEKSKIINNGIDDQKLTELRRNAGIQVNHKLPGEPSLITVGTVSMRKGQLNVIKALPEILKKYPKAHYHIVGMLNEVDQVNDLVAQSGLKPHVTIHGPVPDHELIRLLSGSDLFIMLSSMTSNGDFEGFGIAILEANFMGVPAIGARGTGIEDAIVNHETGMLVDVHSPEQISAAMDSILGNREKFSAAAVQFANDHTWKQIIQQYLKVLQN